MEEKEGGEKVRIGMVVRTPHRIYWRRNRQRERQKELPDEHILIEAQVIRGNSVVMLEALERIGGGREDRN